MQPSGNKDLMEESAAIEEQLKHTHPHELLKAYTQIEEPKKGLKSVQLLLLDKANCRLKLEESCKAKKT